MSTLPPDKDKPLSQAEESRDLSNRRELVGKLGKFAAYAAPLTLLVTAEKAKAFSQHP